MKKILKVVLYVFLALFAIGVITSIFDEKDTASSSTASSGTSNNEASEEFVEEDKPDIDILSTNDKADQFAHYVYVKVSNNTDNLASYLDLNVTFYDANDQVVGTGIGNTSNLPAGQSRVITAMATNINGATRYEVNIGNTMFE